MVCRPEDQEPAKWRSSEWQERDVLSAPLNSQIQDSKLYSRMSNHPIAFKDLQCNVVSRQQITIRNITDIPCRCLSSVKNFGLSAINNECRGDRILEPDEILELMKASNTHCVVWLDVVNSELAGQAEFILSVSALATVWGEYEDEVSIELHAGDDVLPAIRIPIAVLAVTYPVEFPLATPPGPVATASFSLYSMNTSIRLKIKNKSEMPIHVSWLLYNKGEANQPFSVVLDMLTPDFPDPWSFRIMPHYGSTSQYFKVDPITLVLEPNDADFVTFSLDRTKEMYVKRNSNNIVFGQAIGIVTAVKFPEKNCNRVTGFKMPPVTVELQSETRHSLQPNFLVREPNNVFQVQAVQIYRSPDSYHKVTRRFTLLNLLRYPATIFFEADKPFCISAVRTLRCGTRSGNAAIRVIYEDLIRVDIDAVVTVKNCITPKMPANGTSRKIVLSGCLYAKCIDSMTTPSIVSPFKVHIHFPVLKLSTKNINFGQIALRDTKSETVKLSSYSGEEPFLAYSGNDVFEISPTTGTVDVKLPVDLTVKFTPGAICHITG
ncbi:uncharacterized protein LOC126846275 [Adelges cooleyi]|uniref:uncharacterized protein LOC126846275 n=1 Tax=Adelges cooleyi TaxID=133065 RepID=UPI00217F2532|nr:uncharacterized protein LOC126846275 [Adelges cooleyi]